MLLNLISTFACLPVFLVLFLSSSCMASLHYPHTCDRISCRGRWAETGGGTPPPSSSWGPRPRSTSQADRMILSQLNFNQGNACATAHGGKSSSWLASAIAVPPVLSCFASRRWGAEAEHLLQVLQQQAVEENWKWLWRSTHSRIHLGIGRLVGAFCAVIYIFKA